MNNFNQTLDEEITPTLQKLRDERSSYLEYQKVQREAERFTRLLIAYQFLVASRTADNASSEMEEMKAEKIRLQNQVRAHTHLLLFSYQSLRLFYYNTYFWCFQFFLKL